MGTITRSFANNITTSGVLLPASLTNNSIANVTAYNASVSTGGMVLISSQTASASATISFTTGIDSTYKEYQFWFVNIRPATDRVSFSFNLSTDSGSNYNVTKTTSVFRAYNDEAGTSGTLGYHNIDLAQDTAFQRLTSDQDNDSRSSACGTISLFNPASTTYVKHFISNFSTRYDDGAIYQMNDFTAGYGNTTSAVNAVQFKFTSGNIADGTILLYGIV